MERLRDLKPEFDRFAVDARVAPERSGKGPKVHFMVREPGGTRIEFACVSAASV